MPHGFWEQNSSFSIAKEVNRPSDVGGPNYGHLVGLSDAYVG